MARTAYNAVPGMMVYRFGKPLKVGIVQQMKTLQRICMDNSTMPVKGAIVKWMDGTVTDERLTGLQNFQALIEDTARKLATHRATLKKVKAIFGLTT